ncbi:MAG: hypothetical protein HOJ34_14225 [Kordiimonadaceae bacterium]|nr:hypothetical protein [Kordiimonadaceae bacterium]MBT6034906.1 hypothetical protein [Kordiimonadaceae bacterium]MBT6330932.1 hypothetical protein [Kordiimonadaceae bacterium]MBT7582988.1 hypothetical protein [Kordiimonadaceae bacterium]
MTTFLKTTALLLISFYFLVANATAQELDIEAMGPGFHKLEVTHPDGTLQRYIIDIPEGYDGSKAVPMILGLHYGFGGMGSDNRPEPYWTEGFFNKIYQQAFKPLNAIFLAADSVSGNWQSPENEVALNRLWDSVLATYNIDERKTIVTGYSMGAFGTWHWASKYQDRFAGAIPIAGMPADMNTFREDRKMLDTDWKIPLYIMHSHVDGLIDINPTIEYVKKLKADGKDVTFHELFVITHHQENLLPESVGHAVPWIKRIWENID